MPRPRVQDQDLPRYMHRRHGAFYFRDPASKHWIRLGTELEDSKRAMREVRSPLLDTTPLDGESQKAAAVILAQLMHASAKGGAKKRGLPWELAPQDMVNLLAASGWRCAITGLQFSVAEKAGKRGLAPWAPSLDRIDSRLGYTIDNVRLVCAAVNLAMSDMGEEVLLKIAEAMVEKRRISSATPNPSVP